MSILNTGVSAKVTSMTISLLSSPLESSTEIATVLTDNESTISPAVYCIIDNALSKGISAS